MNLACEPRRRPFLPDELLFYKISYMNHARVLLMPPSPLPCGGTEKIKAWESVLLLILNSGSRIALHKDKQRTKPMPG